MVTRHHHLRWTENNQLTLKYKKGGLTMIGNYKKATVLVSWLV